jgi:hypothetical protein
MDPAIVQKAMYLLQKVNIEGTEVPMWNEVMSEFQMYCTPRPAPLAEPPQGFHWAPNPDHPDLPDPI